MNEDFYEAIQSLSVKDIHAMFEKKLQQVYLTIGQLTKKELTFMQERVNVLVEMREEYISIRNQPKKK